MASLKQALYVREQYPDAEVTIFYIDIRSPGDRYEKFYQKVKADPKVTFVKGKVADVQ
jgi:quinone-modifying oxidoreductase subunit QmoA